MSELSDYTVTVKATRPASVDHTCFYCRQRVGEKHKKTCVLIKKTVRIRMTVEYDVECPASWEKHNIEFHRNDGSWCANNALDELASLGADSGCLCYHATFELVADSADHQLDE